MTHDNHQMWTGVHVGTKTTLSALRKAYDCPYVKHMTQNMNDLSTPENNPQHDVQHDRKRRQRRRRISPKTGWVGVAYVTLRICLRN